MKTKAAGAILAGVLLLGTLGLSGAAPAAEKARMVIQVSDNDTAKWNLALNNASNIQKDLGKDNVELEIVAFGPGIHMLKAESEVGNRVADAVGTGIKVMACQNTMRNQKLTRDDMLSAVDYVPAGVVQILRRQQQGFAYLRP